MRISREVYNARMLQIIAAYLRLKDRRKLSHQEISVHRLVLSYGFTHNFSKTDALDEALENMHRWVAREREITGFTPSPERMVNFIRVRIL
jgi:hypothetical protein